MSKQALTEAERALLVDVLKMAADQFGNHGCNDYDMKRVVSNIADRDQIVREMHEWNGDPEEYTSVSSLEPDYRMMDWCVMEFLAAKIEKGYEV